MNMHAMEEIANRFPIPYMFREGIGAVSPDDIVSTQDRNVDFRCYSARYHIHPTQFASLQEEQAGG